MKLAVITHVPHHFYNGNWYAYGPYVNEMNLWSKHVHEIILIAPVKKESPTPIMNTYKGKVQVVSVPDFNLVGIVNTLRALCLVPFIFIKVWIVCKKSSHIHLRCPGNMGLIGLGVQFFFPRKKKSAKYAGNWDPKSKQPWSYKLQQSLLRKEWFCKNMVAMVYGDWHENSKNIHSFFTASYAESEKNTPIISRSFSKSIQIIFVGGINEGKGAIEALDSFLLLKKNFKNIELNFYGDGPFLKVLSEKNIQGVNFHGAVDKETVKKAYQKTHFMLLPSKSEGWPKAVAEAMFWGCVPITTAVSCVPEMLAVGERGVLITREPHEIARKIKEIINSPESYQLMSMKGAEWSRQFTLEKFEEKIKNIL